jgi:hypothetical protein
MLKFIVVFSFSHYHERRRPAPPKQRYPEAGPLHPPLCLHGPPREAAHSRPPPRLDPHWLLFPASPRIQPATGSSMAVRPARPFRLPAGPGWSVMTDSGCLRLEPSEPRRRCPQHRHRCRMPSCLWRWPGHGSPPRRGAPPPLGIRAIGLTK